MYSERTYLSKGTIIMTAVTLIVMIGLGLYTYIWQNQPIVFFTLSGILFLSCLVSLYFMPLEIQVDNYNLNLVFPLRRRSFALKDIKVIKPYKVTMNFVRIWGSGAFFGWWGLYRNQELGRFFVYAANLDNVIYVELNNGKKYVISCLDSQKMTEEILKRLKR